MANFDDSGLTSAALLLLSWSFLSFAIRVWVKLRKSDGWDMEDTVTSAAFVRFQLLIYGFELTGMKLAAICNVTMTCIATRHGYSRRWNSLEENDRSIAEKVQLLKLANVRLSDIVLVAGLLRCSDLLCRICGLNEDIGQPFSPTAYPRFAQE